VTYAVFLAVFLLLPIAGLLVFICRRLRWFHLRAAGLVCGMALLYTSPWDNFAARRGLWSFSPSFVWGRPFWIGALPLEEYLFYIAEAVFVSLMFVALSRLPAFAGRPEESDRTPVS